MSAGATPVTAAVVGIDAPRDCGDSSAGPMEFGELRREYVRLSSRPLGWGPLNFERREAPPSSECLPAGTTEHLVFVSLAGGHLLRDSGGERIERELAPGHVAFQPGGQPVRWMWDTRLTFGVLSLCPDFLDRVAMEAFALAPADFELRPVERAQDPVISNIASVLARETVRADKGSKLYAESLATILAVHLLRNYVQRKSAADIGDQSDPDNVMQLPHSRAVADAIGFIQSRHAQPITLDDIADAVHLSPYHLARLFKQATGETPHQYLIQLRVNSARALLTSGAGQRSLAEIAAAVGFADQSHLTRHFKRQFGVTPKHMRTQGAPARPAAMRVRRRHKNVQKDGNSVQERIWSKR
jgi:AraC family transcriptional regulator